MCPELAVWSHCYLTHTPQVKAGLGGRLKLAVSGAAPLSVQAEEFMRVALCCVAGQVSSFAESGVSTQLCWAHAYFYICICSSHAYTVTWSRVQGVDATLGCRIAVSVHAEGSMRVALCCVARQVSSFAGSRVPTQHCWA